MVFQRGLIGDSSWLWLMTVVVVLMTDCVCCKIKEQKLKDFYLIFCPWSDTESGAESRGALSQMWTKRTTEHDWSATDSG